MFVDTDSLPEWLLIPFGIVCLIFSIILIVFICKMTFGEWK